MKAVASRTKKPTQTRPTVVPFKQPQNEDVIETLAYLLVEASAGRLTGIAYAATVSQGNYITDVAGEAHRKPLTALGMVHVLADNLTRQIRGIEIE